MNHRGIGVTGATEQLRRQVQPVRIMGRPGDVGASQTTRVPGQHHWPDNAAAVAQVNGKVGYAVPDEVGT